MAHRLSPEAENELDDIWYFIGRGAATPILPSVSSAHLPNIFTCSLAILISAVAAMTT